MSIYQFYLPTYASIQLITSLISCIDASVNVATPCTAAAAHVASQASFPVCRERGYSFARRGLKVLLQVARVAADFGPGVVITRLGPSFGCCTDLESLRSLGFDASLWMVPS